MPFDGTGFSDNPALQKLDAVLALLATEAQWCKGALSTSDGRHCLLGAIQAADARLLLEPVVLSAVGDVTGRWFWRIEYFNDHRRTTHALVLRVLQRARERVLMGETAATGARLRIGQLLKSLAGRFVHQPHVNKA